MAYRLRQEETVPHGLRRLATKELRSARAGLLSADPPHDEAIHEARKSIKKVRAILQLIEADAAAGVADGKKRLRAVNRTLSRARDAEAMIEILAKLRRGNPRLFSEHTFVRLRRRLSSHKQEIMLALCRNRSWKKAEQDLRKLRRAVKRWRPDHRGFAAVAAGIRITHRRGRRAMARALKRRRAADFHEWRKRVKTLWYELRLVGGCSAGIRRDVQALDRAETSLGDDHNAVVLCAYLSADPSLCGGPIELQRVQRAVDRYQLALRQRAISSLEPVYAPTPRAYVRRVKRAWKQWHRRDSAGLCPRDCDRGRELATAGGTPDRSRTQRRVAA